MMSHGREKRRLVQAGSARSRQRPSSATSGFFEWACFISQQASEKALKAVLQKLGAEVWGHSIVDLLRTLKERGDVPGTLHDSAINLDRYYIPARYPNGWASGSPADYFTEEDANAAICHSESNPSVL